MDDPVAETKFTGSCACLADGSLCAAAAVITCRGAMAGART